MREPLFLAGIADAPVDATTARRIIEGLLGLDHAPAYDAGLLREATAARVEALAASDVRRALLVRAAVRAADALARELALPPDIGYRREAVRLAGKVFESLVGRRVRGSGPLVAALLAAGARPPAGTEADIVVVTAPEDDPTPTTLAFELEGRAPAADYRFSAADLDAACRGEMRRLHPRDIANRVREAAEEAARQASGPPPRLEDLAPLVERIQDGVRAKYSGHAPSERLFREIIESRLAAAAADPDEARLIGEFLREAAAARHGRRSRR